MTPPDVQRTELHVPTSTIIKLLLTALRKHVIADHGALARAVQSGYDSAVDTLLRAEKHPEERAGSRPPVP